MRIYFGLALFVTFLAFSCICVHAQSGKYAYGEALQKAVFFYEEQKSGVLSTPSAQNRVSWKGNNGLNDGKDSGVDLVGGWLDAGDNVKFVTVLAYGLLEFPKGYATSGQDVYLKRSLRWACDYFIKAHTAPNELYGQVGIGLLDHEWWGSAELLDIVFNTTTTRKSYKISATCPGSDLAAETAAALAATSLVFATEDPTYSRLLLKHAEQLYDFAEKYQGKYTDCITDARSFYNSGGFYDELVWGGAWVSRATGNGTYLDRGLKYYSQITGHYSKTLTWGDKECGAYILLTQIRNESRFYTDARNFLDWWTIGYNGQTVPHTSGGLAFWTNWGSLRYPATTSMLMQIFSKTLKGDQIRQTAYNDFTVTQINYILGSNPLNRSFLGGFGRNPPINEHHRTGHGSWANDWYLPENNRHILYGALVGGPDTLDDFSYRDFRSDYEKNECACDYVAGLCGALAGVYEMFGGEPDPKFPQKETPVLEFLVEASIYARSDAPTSLEILAVLENHSGWPARASSSLSWRYFLSLPSGVKASDVIISQTYSEGGKVSKLTSWGPANVYYIEVSYEGVLTYPGGLSAAHKQSRVQISLQQGSSWDHSSDWSFEGLQEGWPQPANHIPVYEKGTLIWGTEPPKN